MFGMLPSFTQLGMAALLPEVRPLLFEKNGPVRLNNFSTNNTQNRSKLLQSVIPDAIAMQASEFLELKREEGREFTKKYKVVYLYHNGIDAAGDNAKSESEVFNATEKEFKVIKQLIRQILNFNGMHVLITADHGYLYQNQALEESDLCQVEKTGEIWASNRRFVLGKNLTEVSGVKKFNGTQLNLGDEIQVLLAKGLNRIRVQGGGSRYVHGGASLQEIVLPVIHFNKIRQSDTRLVEVDIIKSQSQITTNQIAIIFIQTEPVAEKILSRELKIGFYSQDNQLILDEVKLIFNTTSSDIRGREQKHRFIFKSLINQYNQQSIYLRLMEKIEGTNQYRVYKEDVYNLYISFMSEFDDF